MIWETLAEINEEMYSKYTYVIINSNAKVPYTVGNRILIALKLVKLTWPKSLNM